MIVLLFSLFGRPQLSTRELKVAHMRRLHFERLIREGRSCAYGHALGYGCAHEVLFPVPRRRAA